VIPASWRKPVIDFIDVIARKPQLGRRTIPINFAALIRIYAIPYQSATDSICMKAYQCLMPVVLYRAADSPPEADIR
jgi:hypothetical protein